MCTRIRETKNHFRSVDEMMPMKQLSNYDIDLMNKKRREPTEFTFKHTQTEVATRQVKRRVCTEVNVRDLNMPIALLVTSGMLMGETTLAEVSPAACAEAALAAEGAPTAEAALAEAALAPVEAASSVEVLSMTSARILRRASR